MTVTAETPETVDDAVLTRAAAGRSAVDATLRERWRRNRVIAGVVLLVVVVAVAVTLLNAPGHQGDLDPRSYESSGTHALAALLGARGVHVDTETTIPAAQAKATADSTLVVVNPDRLDPAQLPSLVTSRADLVIVGAGPLEVGGLGLGVVPGGHTDGDRTLEPACDLLEATAAGAITQGGFAYRKPAGGSGCYPLVDGYAVVTLSRDGHRVTFVGDGAAFTNARLAEQGNAALGIGLLDVHPDVVWLAPPLIAPTSTTSTGGGTSLTDLLPSRLKWALLQLAIAVAVVAIWRGRRLGRLVPEALPVVVRQAETVVGRAQLYRRSHALDRAADALRAGARALLAHRLGFGPDSGRHALTEAIARRTTRGEAEVGGLLYGPTPVDDRELVTLANDLASLEQETLQP